MRSVFYSMYDKKIFYKTIVKYINNEIKKSAKECVAFRLNKYVKKHKNIHIFKSCAKKKHKNIF